MKALQKASKFLSDYTSLVVIAIAVVTFFVPAMMGWVNNPLFVDPVSNKFTCQSIIIGIIMFSMGLTLTTEDFKILAQRPFDICIGAIAQYLIMPFLAFALTKVLQLPDGIALGLILVGCCPGGVSSNIMSYLCGGDVAFSVGMTTVSTIISPVMTPLMVSLLAPDHSEKLPSFRFCGLLPPEKDPVHFRFVVPCAHMYKPHLAENRLPQFSLPVQSHPV